MIEPLTGAQWGYPRYLGTPAAISEIVRTKPTGFDIRFDYSTDRISARLINQNGAEVIRASMPATDIPTEDIPSRITELIEKCMQAYYRDVEIRNYLAHYENIYNSNTED